MINEVGRLVRDGEIKDVTLSNGAQTQVYQNAIAFYSGAENDTILNFEAWGTLAAWLSKKFTKGQPVFLCGQLRQREWTDNSGQKRTQLYISVKDASYVPGDSRREKTSTEKYSEALEASDTPLPY